MFFGNKKNDVLIEVLNKEILELKNKLEDKDSELKNLINSNSLKLEDVIKIKIKRLNFTNLYQLFHKKKEL